MNAAEVVELLRSLADQAAADARESDRVYGRGHEEGAFARVRAETWRKAADIVTRQLVGKVSP